MTGPLRDLHRELLEPHPRRLPSRDRSKRLRVRRRSTGLSKRACAGDRFHPWMRPAGVTRP